METYIPIVKGICAVGGTGLICSIILVVASKFFAVNEDPRIGQVASLLPGANCGGCGYAGCADYAKEIVLNGADANKCGPGGAETIKKIASFLGVEANIEERKVAIVLCNGDDSKAIRKSLYNGVADCAAAELASGGPKACRYGCLGLGSCARVCPVGAIEITSGNIAFVHPGLCIGCGKCVAVCPRRLIKLAPESRYIHVLCSSKDRGPAVKKVCSVGCIACAICAKTANNQGIKMDGALAVVDYTVPFSNEDVITKCPQHTIVKRSGMKEA
jgi:electron transport complex protein RnfB